MIGQRFDGHTLNLYFDSEHWLAHFVERPEISAFSATPEDALRKLQTAWDFASINNVDTC